MKHYFFILAVVIIVVGGYGTLIPWMVSTRDTLTFFGGLALAAMIPVLLYLLTKKVYP